MNLKIWMAIRMKSEQVSDEIGQRPLSPLQFLRIPLCRIRLLLKRGTPERCPIPSFVKKKNLTLYPSPWKKLKNLTASLYHPPYIIPTIQSYRLLRNTIFE